MSSCDASGYILLPKGFVRIRHFGFMANRRRATLLPLCFPVLNAAQPSHIRIRGLPCQGTHPALALSQKWLPQGGHRETYACPAPTAFSTLSRRSRRMKLNPRPLLARCSCPQTRLSASNFRSKACSHHLQLLPNQTCLPSCFAPRLLPGAILITPTPLHLHKHLPTGGLLQTAVSDAPRTT